MTDVSHDSLFPPTAPADENQTGNLGAHLENLQGHIERCHDIEDARLPLLLLSACQAIFEFEPAGDALIARKRRVFEAIDSGNMIVAIRAILPDRITTHYGAKREGAFAMLEDGRGTSVRTHSSTKERAFLAGVIEMALALHTSSQSLAGPQALRAAA